MPKTPTSLILNSPYVVPAYHWKFVEENQPLERVSGRRIAGYMVADPRVKPYQGEAISLPFKIGKTAELRLKSGIIEAWRA